MAAIYFFMWVAFVLVWGCWSRRVDGENNECPSACTCLGRYIDCSDIGLIEIPQDLPDWVTELIIHSNGILELHNDDFKGLNQLYKIDLSNNEISSVNESVFRNVPALTELKMNGNKLTDIPPLPGNPALRRLELSHNDIDKVDHDALSALRQLHTLDLSYNDLMDIRPGSFPANLTLAELSLRNNRIITLAEGCFDNLTSLESLQLNKNAISFIHKNLFHSLTNLRLLDLSKNRLSSLESLTFDKLNRLQDLKLRRNFLTVLPDGVFYGLHKILKLRLDRNSIPNITNKWLYGLLNLRHLSVSQNKISMIGTKAWEEAPKLESLDMAGNNMTMIGTETFSHLTRLTSLNLTNNRVDLIQEDAFKPLSSLKVLDLNHNLLSWTIEGKQGAFLHLERLRWLGLAYNRIPTITKQTFEGLTSLETLELQYNNITMIHGNAFDNLPDLKSLKINTSSLFCDCQLSWLPMWLRERSHESSVTARCKLPKNLNGKSIFAIFSNDFKCDQFPKPEIVRHPQSQKVSKGGNMTLDCYAASTETQGAAQFQWKKDNRLIDSTSAVEIESYAKRSDNLTHYMSKLYIRTTRDSDAGKYQCIISNSFGSAYSDIATIGVFVFPTFTKTPGNVTVRSGSQATLICAADGEPQPTITWKKEGGFEDSFPAAQEQRMKVIPADDYFFIVNIKPADEGVYSCIAHNEAGTISANVTLTVQQKPAFVKPMERKYTKVGSTTVLECLAAGSPRPKLSWKFGGRPLVSTQRHFFTAENQLLVIVETQPSDDGDYTCEMSNNLGTVKGTSTLTVITAQGGHVGESGEGGLDDESTTTGIIIIAVVCCVVGTSLVWVIIIYQTRKRQEMYSATPTDETTLPGEVPSSGYMSSEKEVGYGPAGGGPVTMAGYQYQLDMQMKESGYESSSGRFRAARSAAIFPSDVDGDDMRPPTYTMITSDGHYIEQSDENSVSSSREYPRSETDSLKSDNSVMSSHSSRLQTLHTFHPHATNHDRLEPAPLSADVRQISSDPNAGSSQCENSVSSQTDDSIGQPSYVPCDSDQVTGRENCSPCRHCVEGAGPVEGAGRGRCTHGSPAVAPKPSWLMREPDSDLPDIDSPQHPGHQASNSEPPGSAVGYTLEQSPPQPLVTYPNIYMRPDRGEPLYMPSSGVVGGGPHYVAVYQPMEAPCDCHLHYPPPGPQAPSVDHRGHTHSTNPANQRQNGIMGCVHHHMNPVNPAWHGHAYTLPYLPGHHMHQMTSIPPQTSPRQHNQPVLSQEDAPQESPQQQDPGADYDDVSDVTPTVDV